MHHPSTRLASHLALLVCAVAVAHCGQTDATNQHDAQPRDGAMGDARQSDGDARAALDVEQPALEAGCRNGDCDAESRADGPLVPDVTAPEASADASPGLDVAASDAALDARDAAGDDARLDGAADTPASGSDAAPGSDATSDAGPAGDARDASAGDADAGTVSCGAGGCFPRCTSVAACRAVRLSAGGGHACALTAGGGVACWGDDAVGQLGDGTQGDASGNRTTAVRAVGVAGAVQVSAGSLRTCALLGSGQVLCWGGGGDGGLGNGTRTAWSLTPVAVSGLTDAVSIAVGIGFPGHVCASRATGAVVCWGQNVSGELGDGTTVTRDAPVLVPGITDAVQVAAGSGHSCALRASGGVTCWGQNDHGQLGDGSTTRRLVPVAVRGLADAVAIAAGDLYTCALRASGGVVCWGAGGDAQLGDGLLADSAVPVAVAGVSGVVALRSGFTQSCVWRATGEALCWGGNEDSALSSSCGALCRTAVTPALARDTELSTSVEFTCGLHPSGAVDCWGGNVSGQLGDGTLVPHVTPMPVVGVP